MQHHGTWQTLFHCGREVTAVTASIVRAKFSSLRRTPYTIPQGTLIIATGFGSYPALYEPQDLYFRAHGYDVRYARSLLRKANPELYEKLDRFFGMQGYAKPLIRYILRNLELTIPEIPLAISAFEEEVRDIAASTDRPITLLGHSLGGIVIAAAMPKIGHLVRRAVLLGSPFDASHVFPFLVELACDICQFSLNPLSQELATIIDLVEDPDPELRSKMLTITVPGDRLAPPEAGGLPNVLMASYEPRGLLNSHAGMIFDYPCMKLARTFFELDSEDTPPAETLGRRFPQFRLERRTLAELPNFEHYRRDRAA